MAVKGYKKKILDATIKEWEQPITSLTGVQVIARGDALERLIHDPVWKKWIEPFLETEIAGTALHLTLAPSLAKTMEEVEGMRQRARAFQHILQWVYGCIQQRNTLQEEFKGRKA